MATLDWHRARTLLLVMFTVTNVLLAYMLWGPGARSLQPDTVLDTIQEREVRDRLAREGINLRATLPPSGAELRLLRVGMPNPDVTEALAERLRNLAQTYQVTDPDAVVQAVDGAVHFRPPHPIGGEVKLDSRSAVRDLAGRIIDGLELATLADLQWSRMFSLQPDRRVVEYSTHYQDRPLWSGYVHVAVERAGVVWVSAFIPTIGSYRGTAKAVISPAEALLRLTGHLQARRVAEPDAVARFLDGGIRGRDAGAAPLLAGRITRGLRLPPGEGPGEAAGAAAADQAERLRIEEITLGYYAARPAEAHTWDTVPTWRVTTDQGQAFYINAFTGELES